MNYLGRLVAPSRFPSPIHQSRDRTIQAVVIHEHGEEDVMKWERFPAPVPHGSQILVRIVAAGINPVDFKMRKGPISDLLYPKPKIIGCDMSGVVLQAPPESLFQPGQRVYAMLPILGSHYGSYASECCLDESLLAPAVETFPLEELAALPLVSCTIIQALRPIRTAYNNETRGKKCFIQAGSGGLGTIAIQYCAHVLGMYVVTTCSIKNRDLVLGLGAAEFIDYQNEKIEDRLKDFDVFIDTIGYVSEELVLWSGNRILKKSFSNPSHYIRIASSPYGDKNGGEKISEMSADPFGMAIPEARIDRMITGYSKQFMGLFNGIRYHFILVHPDKDALMEMNDALRVGKVKPVIQSRFLIHEVVEAHRLIEQGHVAGKLILLNDEYHC